MVGQFTSDRDFLLLFGSLTDETSVVFERIALERLARLAHELLAVPAYEEEVATLPVLVSPSVSEDAGAPNLAAGEESIFIRELREMSRLIEPYVRWLWGSTRRTTNRGPLRSRCSCRCGWRRWGHAVRELALARMDGVDRAGADDAGDGNDSQGNQE